MTSKLNIYKYLTPDIAAHCKKIKHMFNSLEMAVIVERSRKTVKEKIAAWQKIIDGHSDMPIPGGPWFKARKSLHRYLKWWIAQHEKWIADFYADGGGKAFFRPYLRTDIREPDQELGGCYSTIKKALGAVRKDALESVALRMECKPSKTKIVKETIDDRHCRESTAWFNSKGELLEIYDGLSKTYKDSGLDSIFIHVPVPFEIGDIVTDDGGFPMVLVGCSAWDREWWDEMMAKECLDGTDMDGLAYAAESFFENSSAHEHPETLELRYYKKELQGQERFLKAFSEFVKDQGEGRESLAVHLIAAFRKFQSEADAKKLADTCWDDWFEKDNGEAQPQK